MDSVTKFLVIVLGSFALISCFIVSKTENRKESDNWKILHYNGHSYILYENVVREVGITHNPDCKCINSK